MMSIEVRTAAEAIRQRPLDASKLVENFVHALRNPLFAAQLDLHTLRRLGGLLGDGQSRLEEFEAVAGQCERHVARVEGLLAELVQYACPAPAMEEAVDLRQALEHAAARLHEKLPSAIIAARMPEAGAPTTVVMDALRLEHVLSNLFSGLSQDAGAGEEFWVRLRSCEVDAVLTITNRDWAWSDRERRRAFKPFAAIAGRKFEFALATAKRYVEEAGGKLACVAAAKGGTCFRLRLPLCSNPLREM